MSHFNPVIIGHDSLGFTIALTWTARSDIELYSVWYETEFYSNSIQVYAQSDTSITYYFDVNTDSKYTFKVCAYDSTGWGDWSSIYTCYSYQTLPTASYPSYYPQVTHQWVYNPYTFSWIGQAGSCTANALATVKEIQEYREGKGSTLRYSISWIFGNRLPSDYQGNAMYATQALNRLQADGVPPYEVMPGNMMFPDVRYYYDYSDAGYNFSGASTVVTTNYSSLIGSALPQRISSYTALGRVQSVYVKPSVTNSSLVVIVELTISNNFYEAESNGGIVPPSDFTVSAGHTMVILGWKQINGTGYWICQNSWGTWVGDNGLFYLPFDYWGITNYYAVSDAYLPTPNTPTLVAGAVTSSTMNIIRTVNSSNGTQLQTYMSADNVAFATVGDYCNAAGYGYSNTSGTLDTGLVLTLTGLPSGTTFYFKAKGVIGGMESVWSNTVFATTTNRPPNYYWRTPKVSGEYFYLGYDEWNGLTNSINDFRAYKGLQRTTFTTAYFGYDLTATMFNQVITAMASLSPYFRFGNTIPSSKSTGNDIYASYLNDIVNALNSIA